MNIYTVETEARNNGLWKSDETFHVIAWHAIAAADKIQRQQNRKWNNVRVRSVHFVGPLS